MSLAPKAKLDYPLHWYVYLNDEKELENLLQRTDVIEIDKLDPRGRSPLMLAVTLGHTKCAKLLFQKGADADAHNKEMWSVLHESVAFGDPEMIRLATHYRDYQRANRGSLSMRNTLNELKNINDFYCEMSWDFSSWVPFLSQSCPSDTYKIYKGGSSVRIDTTLASFEGTSWRRANQSLIFRVNEQNMAEFLILDHDIKSAMVQVLKYDEPFENFEPSASSIEKRMTEPLSTSYIDVDGIGFEKASRGILPWLTGSDKTENVNGYECNVLAASNVQLVTKKRFDHLSAEDRLRIENEEASSASAKALTTVMKILQPTKAKENTEKDLYSNGLSALDYLDPNYKFEPKCDIGRVREVVRKSSAFKATLWMAEEFPLKLNEQVIPIVELMAVNSPHFARLNDFIRLQLPAGFPVKIEIPLFHVMSARISFKNVNSMAPFVQKTRNETVIDEAAFQVPTDYSIVSEENSSYSIMWNDEDDNQIYNNPQNNSRIPTEEMLLQMAIEQSLINQAPMSSDEQLAHELQFDMSNTAEDSDAIRAALRASRQEEEERRRREQEQFDEEMRMVLELSKHDK